MQNEEKTITHPQPPSGGVGGGTESKARRNSSSSSTNVSFRCRVMSADGKVNSFNQQQPTPNRIYISAVDK